MTDEQFEELGFIEDKRYHGLLGMCEMEEALWHMERMAIKGNTLIEKLRVYPENFVNSKRQSLLVGFCHLVYNEWVIPDYPNCEFIPSDKLIDRLNKRWGSNFSRAKRRWEMVEEYIKKRSEEEKERMP